MRLPKGHGAVSGFFFHPNLQKPASLGQSSGQSSDSVRVRIFTFGHIVCTDSVLRVFLPFGHIV